MIHFDNLKTSNVPTKMGILARYNMVVGHILEENNIDYHRENVDENDTAFCRKWTKKNMETFNYRKVYPYGLFVYITNFDPDELFDRLADGIKHDKDILQFLEDHGDTTY